MFWIVGGGAVIRALLRGYEDPWLVALDSQFRHFEWEGFCFWDLIMPLFLFMIGVSMFQCPTRLPSGLNAARVGGEYLATCYSG